jgi:hypothetical protein
MIWSATMWAALAMHGARAQDMSEVSDEPSPEVLRQAMVEVWTTGHRVWGLLVEDARTVVAPAPVFDLGRSVHVEGTKPEDVWSMRAEAHLWSSDPVWLPPWFVLQTAEPVPATPLAWSEAQLRPGDTVYVACSTYSTALAGVVDFRPERLELCATQVTSVGPGQLVLGADGIHRVPHAPILDGSGHLVGFLQGASGQATVLDPVRSTHRERRDVWALDGTMWLFHQSGGIADQWGADVGVGFRLWDGLFTNLLVGMGAAPGLSQSVRLQVEDQHGFTPVKNVSARFGAELGYRFMLHNAARWPVYLELAAGARGSIIARKGSTAYLTDEADCDPQTAACRLRVETDPSRIPSEPLLSYGPSLGGGLKLGVLGLSYRITPGPLERNGDTLHLLSAGLTFP